MHCHDVTNCMRITEFAVPFVIMYATNNGDMYELAAMVSSYG